MTKQELRNLLKDALHWKIFLTAEDLDKWEELVPAWLKALEDEGHVVVCVREASPYLDYPLPVEWTVWGVLHATVSTDSLNYIPVSREETAQEAKELQAPHEKWESLQEEQRKRYNDAPRLREALFQLLACIGRYPDGTPFHRGITGALIQAEQVLKDIPPYPALTALNKPEDQ